MPFGMVQLGPDTRLSGWDGCSGYHYSDEVIYGFSHTHLSGTGCSDYGDILVTATTGEPVLSRGEGSEAAPPYGSRFRHATEQAEPGYYAVELEDFKVKAEMTVTPRCGVHRYTFPDKSRANIIIDLLHRDRVIDSAIRVTGPTTIEGYRRSSAWAKDQHVYFFAEFSEPFESYGIALDGRVLEGVNSASGVDVKAFFSFDRRRGGPVTMKIGLSAVDVEGAGRNLAEEIARHDFKRVRTQAREAWRRELGRIRVEGGTEKQKRTFYTALYHCLLAPNLYSDVDGRYRGRDLAVHRADGFDYYTVFSLWDTYRAAHPLFTIIERERTVDFLRTFLAQYRQGGALPVWELAANETGTMIGYHAVPVIADAWAKGIRDFDTEEALEAMIASADQDHLGLKYYKELGFIPADGEGQSVSRTLEYAYDDWCIAVFAEDLGHHEVFKRFIRRAQGYKHLFDPATGFMRPRMNGGWLDPFDPAEVNFHYTEANAWQYSFYVPQDMAGLIDLMGGREVFSDRLDDLFETESDASGLDLPDVSGLVGQYAHGNEPSHHMAYLYDYAGMPWKTQDRVREIMKSMYTDVPDGLCGNEDCGQMSAWYVFSALGFYPVTPGSDVYAIGAPLFERAEIRLESGKTFRVQAPGTDNGRYIRGAELNGKKHTAAFLRHEEIMRGGTLEFSFGKKRGASWGTAEGDIPPSAIADDPVVPAPWLEPAPRSFAGSIEISMGCADPEAKIRYETDGSDPTKRSREFERPMRINRSAQIRAAAFRDGRSSPVVVSRFERLPDDRAIVLGTRYSSMYTAGGDLALIDLVRGGDDFRTGAWQGYHGVDLVATVDLGRERSVRRVSIGFIQEEGSWIFLPSAVEIALSRDGVSFETAATLAHDIPLELEGSITREFSAEDLRGRARYVRVTAKNIGDCPAWHPGVGHPAWLFADEIEIDAR
jgi:predicted alpha-1,2-mannosidase